MPFAIALLDSPAVWTGEDAGLDPPASLLDSMFPTTPIRSWSEVEIVAAADRLSISTFAAKALFVQLVDAGLVVHLPLSGTVLLTDWGHVVLQTVRRRAGAERVAHR